MDSSSPSHPKNRPLGLVSATALVVASMIGSGVFTTSGFLLAELGSPWRVLGAWLGGGLIAILGALCYGALARRIPESGGEYVFLSRTLHPAAGFMAGWVSLLVGFSAPLAAVALAFGEYVRPWAGGWTPRQTGSGLLIGLSLVHALHVGRGAWIQNLAVGLKLALMALFLVLGFTALPSPPALGTAPPIPASFSISAFGAALVWVSFSYSGWNAAVYVGGEIRDPERIIPRALLLGTLGVTLIYVLLNALFLYSAPFEALAGRLEVARIAAEALGGARLGTLVTALVALALTTSVSSGMMAGPRVYARMAEDGVLPDWLRSTQGPPRAAILFQCTLALGLMWTATFQGLLTYIGFTLGLSTAATVVGIMRLRLREGPGMTVPGWPWMPATFLICMGGISLGAFLRQPKESLMGLASLGLGGLVWRFGNRRSKEP